jgi:hypothetical protein
LEFGFHLCARFGVRILCITAVTLEVTSFCPTGCMLELVSFHTEFTFEVNVLVTVGVRVRFAFRFNKCVRLTITFYILRCSNPFNLTKELFLL